MSETITPEPDSDNEVAMEVNEDAVGDLIASLQKNQNMPFAIVAGVVSSLVGGAVWAGITIATEYQIGWMAVGVGFLVGFSVKAMGKGIEQKFGYVGAAFALFGCLLGNLFTQVGFAASEYGESFVSIFFNLDMASVMSVYVATFSPMDLLFYGIAVYQGFKFSFQELDDSQLSTLQES